MTDLGPFVIVPQQGVHAHDEARRAEAALRPVALGYPLLNRVELVRVPEAFHRRHRHAVHPREWDQAGVHGDMPIHKNIHASDDVIII